MQCISITYQMLRLSATVPKLCPQPKSSLINHLICWMVDQLSFGHRRNSTISRREFQQTDS